MPMRWNVLFYLEGSIWAESYKINKLLTEGKDKHSEMSVGNGRVFCLENNLSGILMGVGRMGTPVGKWGDGKFESLECEALESGLLLSR